MIKMTVKWSLLSDQPADHCKYIKLLDLINPELARKMTTEKDFPP